jgi:8-oxo-dGTP pyrophosphatase MutT (NUDIX family)
MTVFPGGGVDSRDAEANPAWAGPKPSWWADTLGCDIRLAGALVCAAVRETFEESGVLLAGPEPDTVVADTTGQQDARESLVQREFSFAQFLADNGLVLRADLLRPWANWVTPAQEVRRYDTRFFVAVLPDGQRADGITSEAEHAYWRRPADAIDDWKAGRCGLLPPTWVTLAELAEYRTVSDVMAAERSIDKLIPKVVRDGDVLRLVVPGSPDYDQGAGHLDARADDRLERP